jgi:hypothetical protein
MSDTEQRNPFTSRGFIFGAIIFGILVLAAILLAVTSLDSGGGQGTAVPATTATPTSQASELDADAASICGLPGLEESGSLAAAPDAEWTIVGTMAAPSSDDAGPGVVDADGVRSCYAHTVEGAAFAVANLWAMGTDGRLSDLVTERLTVPGAGRDAALARETTQSNTGLSSQIAGVKVLAYDGQNATIDIAFQISDGRLISFPYALSWSEGDWKFVLTDDGLPTFRPVALQSLGGYLPWSGTT